MFNLSLLHILMFLLGGAPGEGEDFQKFQRIKDVSSKKPNCQQQKSPISSRVNVTKEKTTGISMQ